MRVRVAVLLLLVAAIVVAVLPGFANGAMTRTDRAGGDGQARPTGVVGQTPEQPRPGRREAPRATPTGTYTVQPGDTLWVIARRTAPDTDPREVIDRLIEDNHLRGGLQPGQQLVLPPSRR